VEQRERLLLEIHSTIFPILSTLKQIHQIRCMRDEILRPLPEGDEVLHDFSDGKIFKEHVLFRSDPHSLQIIAYYDEVETCNVLGSSSGEHK